MTMIGKKISHYEILEKLGEGGMGVVYKAKDLKLNRFVAIKFLPENLVQSPDAVMRFQQEAEAISALNHPNIATIYDVDATNGLTFLVLEYIPGGTLKSAIKDLHSTGKELSIKELIEYGIQIADGLAHAHKHRIIHRDIKTANMMLSEGGRIKITDFGLAKLHGSIHLTKTGSTLGTAAYMSPEQIRGEDVDYRSDIFSFGVVLYELTTGRLPFRGEHAAALSYSIVNEAPIPLASLRPDVSHSFERIVNRCLEKDKEKRCQNAEEITRDLRELMHEPQDRKRISSVISKRIWITAIVSVMLLASTLVYFLHRSGPTSPERKSLAVLPFKNVSQDIENEYFSDGITEDIITHLSRIEGLKVISPTSAMRFKNTDKSMQDIGKELGITTVLQGSVRRSGNRVRIGAQLINTSDDEQLWGEIYDRDLTDVFQIQSQIAQQIADALKLKLNLSTGQRKGHEMTENLEAYDLYLRGRFYWNKRLPNDLRKSIQYYEDALSKDPGYAKAFAGLADSYIILGDFNILPPKETYPKAREAAMKALEIDAEIPEAHTSLAYALMHYDRDWPGAEREFQRAIELAPNSAQAHSWYALYLSAMGQFDEAVAETQRARVLDPFSAVILTDAGLTLYLSGRYDIAIDLFREALKTDPTFIVANIPLGGAYIQKQMDSAAIAAFQQVTLASAFVTSKANPVPIAALAYVCGISNRREDALMYIELLQEKAKEEYVSPYWMSVAYVGLGNTQEVFKWLEKAYEERDGSLIFIKVDPTFNKLHSDPRFLELLRKVGLQE